MSAVRVSLFCASVGGVGLLLAARDVYARAASTLSESSEGILGTGAMGDGVYPVRLNGARMMISSAMSDVSVHEALDEASAECRARSGKLGDDVAKLPKKVAGALGDSLFGILRNESDEGGYVACLVRDDGDGVTALGARVRTLTSSLDLGALGRLHMVTARRTKAATRTHLLRAWTVGSLPLGELAKRDADAPGSDMEGVPRPEGSRRILDAEVEGSPFGVRIYDAPAAPDVVLARYDAALSTTGWRKLEGPPADMAEHAHVGMRFFEQRGANLIITASARDGRSVVSLASLAAR